MQRARAMSLSAVHLIAEVTPSFDESVWIPQVISGMIRIATMFATLIIGLIAGPAVSLKGRRPCRR